MRFFQLNSFNEPPSHIVLVIFVLLCGFNPIELKGQTTVKLSSDEFSRRIVVGEQLLALEDSSGQLTIDEVIRQQAFLTNFKTGGPRTFYWMKFRLENTSDQAIDIVYTHGRMSSARLYQVWGDSVIFQAKSGEYLKGSNMEKGETRYTLTFRISAQSRDDFYVRIQNTRDRGPKMFVGLKGLTTHHADLNSKYIVNFVLIGALAIFVIYAFSLFIVHRYRPYLWLSLMILAFAGYTFAVNGYLTDWVFPESPKLSKTFTPPIGQFGKFCMLMVLLTFLDVREKYPKWYRVFMGLIVMYVARFLYMYYITIVHEDFGMSTFIGSVTALVTNIAYIAFVLNVFKKLNRGKRGKR